MTPLYAVNIAHSIDQVSSNAVLNREVMVEERQLGVGGGDLWRISPLVKAFVFAMINNSRIFGLLQYWISRIFYFLHPRIMKNEPARLAMRNLTMEMMSPVCQNTLLSLEKALLQLSPRER